MAESPDQRQLKLQEGSFYERNDEHIPYESNTHRVSMKKNIPLVTWYAFLALFGVCFGGTLRGYASGSVEVPSPFEEPNKSIRSYQIECVSLNKKHTCCFNMLIILKQP